LELKVKVKVNVNFYSASSWTHDSGMARVLKRSHSFTCTPLVHPLTEWTIPAFAIPAEAGTHLPTPGGLGWLVGYIPK